MNAHNKNLLGILSDGQALPNATSVDSTNMVNVGGKTNGRIWIDVYANTAISIATGQAFNIELEGYSSDTAASAVSPIDDAHIYILHKTSADGQLDFAAGALIAQIAIPEDLFDAKSWEYVQLKYTTDADESSEKVDAIAYTKI